MSETITSPAHKSLSSKLRYHPLTTLRDELDDLLSRFLGGADEGWLTGRMSPPVDVSETDTAIEVRLDLPGVKADEIDIHLTGNMLNVCGERKDQKEEKGRTFHRVERRRGNLSRSIALPCAIEEDEVAAEYKDGVLTITLPKCEEAKSHRIAVKHD